MKANKEISIELILKGISYIIAVTAFMSVFMHIGIVYKLIGVFLLGLSLSIDFKTRIYVQRTIINLTTVFILFATFYRIDLNDPATPVIEGLTVLLFVKFLEEKAFRDYMQIYTISLFILSGSALYNIDMSFLAFFLTQFFLTGIAIVILTFYSENKETRLTINAITKTITTALLIPLISIPMLIGLFFILPRTTLPLFTFLNRPEKGITGFTDNIRLGDVSGIQEDASVIFRANMPRVDDNSLYWRGVVLDYFDGISWTRSNRDVTDVLSQRGLKGEVIQQGIFLEPYDNRYLFGLDRPVGINMRGARFQYDLTVMADDVIKKRTYYVVNSIKQQAVETIRIDTEVYTQLPEISDKVKNLSRSLTEGKDALSAVNSIVSFFSEKNFKYSLQNLPITQNPLEDFLFEYRFGNCEYFASATAVLLRASGIPARLVVGYRGGYYNPIAGYYVVTQQSAHVWTEVYINRHWVRIDTTPGSFIVGQRDASFQQKIRIYLDTINYYWNQMIIGYDFEKQMRGFRTFQSTIRGLKFPSFQDLKSFIPYILFFIGILITIKVIINVVMQRKTFEQRLIQDFEKRLKKKGYIRKKHQGLRDFVETIRDDEYKQKVFLFVKEVEEVFYKDIKPSRQHKKRFKELLRAL
ncbi:MAG: DUF3488 and transglutaminase-like domain-containing protein [Thermodesulfovibrionales bacterium]|nr:DUF3488 and transglutaminase-like domain-containing protein [Thermodesulfovibrionales bacterium]